MLPEGHTARPASLDDAAGVAALIEQQQLACFGSSEISESEVRNDWAGADLAADTIVIERGGEVRAAADLVVRPGQVSVYGYVHPEDTGRGLGSYLAAWAERRASALGVPTVVRHYLPSTNGAAVRLFEERGYEFQRAVLWMERDLVSAQRVAADGSAVARRHDLPGGLVTRTYRGDDDEPAVYQAFEAGSLDMNGRVPNTLEQWLASARTKDRELFFIVEEVGSADADRTVGGRTVGGSSIGDSMVGRPAVVGVLIASMGESRQAGSWAASGSSPESPAPERVGHVDSLRVVREWRRRGIGAALLATAFEALRARGAVRVGLSVDAASPTGAPNLYLDAGMRVTRRYLVVERTFGSEGGETAR
jgi:ribosomal protein S18 acetylase RimI-like enzyme